MEFDHVILLLTHSEYYLKYYLPQAISRCKYDLNLIFLPKLKGTVKKHHAKNLLDCSLRSEVGKHKYTAGDLNKEWKQETEVLIKQWNVADCRICEETSNIFTEDEEMSTFSVHSHSDEYKAYELNIEENMESEDQVTVNSCHAEVM